jgi:hypothetical protein
VLSALSPSARYLSPYSLTCHPPSCLSQALPLACHPPLPLTCHPGLFLARCPSLTFLDHSISRLPLFFTHFFLSSSCIFVTSSASLPFRLTCTAGNQRQLEGNRRWSEVITGNQHCTGSSPLASPAHGDYPHFSPLTSTCSSSKKRSAYRVDSVIVKVWAWECPNENPQFPGGII